MATRLEKIGTTIALVSAAVALVGCQVTYTNEKGMPVAPPSNTMAKAIIDQTAIYNDVEKWNLPEDMDQRVKNNREFTDNLKLRKQDFINFSDRYKIPPEVAPTIWYLNTGGKMENPTDGWGICGTRYIYAIESEDIPNVKKGRANPKQLLYQLNRCAGHFSNFAVNVNVSTTDFDVLGKAYAEYFDWNQFIPWKDNPHLANGWDAKHTDPSKPLGALVIHAQINKILFH
jgi:hypothetical protein